MGTTSILLDDEYNLIPGTWNALCRNPQVWVTSSDGWTQCKGSVENGVLKILAKDSSCNETVDWLVISERNDKHMYESDWTDSNGRPILEPSQDA